MTFSDIIQLGILLVTVVALLWSQYSDRKQRRLSMFAEYTKRYQDIILLMPDNVYVGVGGLDALSLTTSATLFRPLQRGIPFVASRHFT